MNSNKPSICIVAHNAYGVLANIDTGHAGGIEIQTPLMARWLAREGFSMSMITWDEGYEDGLEIDGVRLFKLCRKNEGIPFLRFFVPRWSSLISALNRANPDIIYYNCGDLALGQIVAWARIKNKKTIYSVASEIDCEKELPSMEKLRERLLYKFGLKRVDQIIVQTETQQKLLKHNFYRDSKLIRMPCEGVSSKGDTREVTTSRSAKRILWVGRVSEEKRFELLLDLAEARPDIAFDVVGDSNQSTAYAKIQIKRANSIENVIIHGRVAHQDMPKYYQNATLLCSTSLYEGFPNVFLEAWSIGLPVITTFDPDGLVTKYNLGMTATDLNSLVCSIDLLGSPESWQKASQASQDYFHKFHTVNASMNAVASTFESLEKF